MGIFGNLFGKSSNTNEPNDTTNTTTLHCSACDRDVPEEDFYGDVCAECNFADGPFYCCGIMYDAVQDTCASCGESLR